MNEYTTPALCDLHHAIRAALMEGDCYPEGAKPYGVRLYPDWRRHASSIERVLAERGALFTPIFDELFAPPY